MAISSPSDIGFGHLRTRWKAADVLYPSMLTSSYFVQLHFSLDFPGSYHPATNGIVRLLHSPHAVYYICSTQRLERSYNSSFAVQLPDHGVPVVLPGRHTILLEAVRTGRCGAQILGSCPHRCCTVYSRVWGQELHCQLPGSSQVLLCTLPLAPCKPGQPSQLPISLLVQLPTPP